MTVTVRLDEETEAKVRRLIEQKGGSLSDFVRAAIVEKLTRETGKPTPYELGKHLFGRYRSGLGDVALNHKRYFKEKMRAKHRR
jgi:Arc/MetJ-type ribon-helix-helix transcriptional regulator